MALTKDEAKEFIRELGKATNRKLRLHQERMNGRKKVKRPLKYRLRVFFPPDRVTFRFYKANYELGEYIYTEVVNGVEKGRVVVGMGSNFKPKVLRSWHIPPKETPPEEPVPLTIVRRGKSKKKGKKNERDRKSSLSKGASGKVKRGVRRIVKNAVRKLRKRRGGKS